MSRKRPRYWKAANERDHARAVPVVVPDLHARVIHFPTGEHPAPVVPAHRVELLKRLNRRDTKSEPIPPMPTSSAEWLDQISAGMENE